MRLGVRLGVGLGSGVGIWGDSWRGLSCTKARCISLGLGLGLGLGVRVRLSCTKAKCISSTPQSPHLPVTLANVLTSKPSQQPRRSPLVSAPSCVSRRATWLRLGLGLRLWLANPNPNPNPNTNRGGEALLARVVGEQ